jgi:hypothetical protein
MKFILASLLFVGCLHCKPLSVDIDIEEDGTRYQQKVEYDPVTKAVTYSVPSHNDVISSVNIIHAESNTMLTMFEDRHGKQCLIRSAPAGFQPEANALGAFAVSANKETLTPGRATVIRNIDYRKGKISQRQRMALLESMQNLCEGIDIVEIEQIQVSEEEFMARTVSPFLNNTLGHPHQRSKRTATFSVCDTSSKCGKDVDGARKCLWIVVPHIGADEMEVTHLTNSEWDCITCCEDSQPNGLCACDDITSEETFAQCQADTLAETGVGFS